jgi:ligand-binding sensor protein
METALASAHTGATAQQLEETVANLRRSDIFREYQKAFQTATGLPLVMRTAGSFESPMHGARQGNAFCAIMAAKNKSCAACLQVQQKIEDASHEDVCTVECFAGLSESAVPIRMGAKVLAYLQTGQILLHAPTAKQFARTSRQLAEWGTPVETKESGDRLLQDAGPAEGPIRLHPPSDHDLRATPLQSQQPVDGAAGDG